MAGHSPADGPNGIPNLIGTGVVAVLLFLSGGARWLACPPPPPPPPPCISKTGVACAGCALGWRPQSREPGREQEHGPQCSGKRECSRSIRATASFGSTPMMRTATTERAIGPLRITQSRAKNKYSTAASAITNLGAPTGVFNACRRRSRKGYVKGRQGVAL